jgi:5-methylcytosine-specific restriction endonuclease McrA
MVVACKNFRRGYRIDVESVLRRVRSCESWGVVEGELVKLHRNLRLRVFATKGVKCCSCRRTATHFDVTCNWDERTGLLHAHLELMSGRFLMTVDHFVPRSKGGPDSIENLRPMCFPCNQLKGDELPV